MLVEVFSKFAYIYTLYVAIPLKDNNDSWTLYVHSVGGLVCAG